MTEAWERKIRRIAIASDHAALELKEKVLKFLQNKGIEAIDCGAHGSESVDYPDFAEKVALLVSSGRIPEGILICGTGIGMSMAANKYPGVRAAVASNVFMAKMSRAHNDANILCLGARVLDEKSAMEIIYAWLSEPFEGGRHQRRVDKLKQLDKGILPPSKLEDDQNQC
jgi:ribose 5-phosphate isomerase B